MNEEDYLRSKMGDKNPFKVPEGYFEQLTAKVMDRLPEKKRVRKTVFRQLRPWLYAAACVCFGVFIAAIAFSNKTENAATPQQVAVTTEQTETDVYYSDNYIEEEANYAMVDNQEIYACLLADM